MCSFLVRPTIITKKWLNGRIKAKFGSSRLTTNKVRPRNNAKPLPSSIFHPFLWPPPIFYTNLIVRFGRGGTIFIWATRLFGPTTGAVVPEDRTCSHFHGIGLRRLIEKSIPDGGAKARAHRMVSKLLWRKKGSARANGCAATTTEAGAREIWHTIDQLIIALRIKCCQFHIGFTPCLLLVHLK